MESKPARRVLVSGCGGIGGVNFVNAIRTSESLEPSSKFFILGTEFNEFYIRFSEADKTERSPRHSDPTFVQTITKLVQENKIEFLHPNPSSEAKILKQAIDGSRLQGVATFLPSFSAIAPTKIEMWHKLQSHVPTPEAVIIESIEAIDTAFSRLGEPLWMRAIEGAGARLGLKVNGPEDAKLWVKLNVSQGRAKLEDFMLQPFLPGRDLAYDSLWHRGKLMASSCRQRLEYPLKHISLTGLTGTPSVARTIHERKITEAGREAVLALDESPNGFYSVDLKEDSEGRPFVTEVDGKWHTTAALWGLSFAKAKRDNRFNIASQYVKIGLGLESSLDADVDLYDKGFILIRQMDSGVLLLNETTQEQWRIQ